MKKINQPLKVLLLLISVLVVTTNHARAEKGDWEFNLAPFYLWAINISGDQTIGPISAPVNVEFNDIFDNLDGAFIVHFEAAYQNRWGFLVDVNYLDLENKQSLANSLTRKVDLDITMAELSGFRRWNLDQHNLDVIVGGRYVRVANNISVLGGPALVDGAQDWIDPLVGGRWIWNFAEDWAFVGRGDIGGFGVGSNFAWQAAGILEWQPFKYVSFLAGYRAVGMDYEDGNQRSPDYFNFDATVHGPVLGINFKW
ncbi:MAG: hypothetical protein P8X86_17345 [Desulfofustis sp.]